MKVRNQKYLNAFGKQLAKLLEEKGKTPEEVAAHANIETKQIYRVLNGEHSATISITYAIAKGLGVHPKSLFDFNFVED
jgi:transcriptional regulator with XRE-family HTH domain